jgi:hypothetical protein
VGLCAKDLASFARSWKVIHAYKCRENELDWAAGQAQNLGYECQFKRIDCLDLAATYPAIVVSSAFLRFCEPEVAFSLLKPGGAAAWFPGYGGLPSAVDLDGKGFESVRSYAFLPPSSGKILVPLDDSKLTMAGLNLYVPGKWQNRWALRIAKAVSTVGFLGMLGIQRVVIARKPGCLTGGQYLVDWLSTRIGRSIEDVSIYNGWTKTVLQLLDRQGYVIGFLKIANTKLGRDGILRENNALSRLEREPALRGFVPRVLSTGDWQQCTFQIQTAAESGPQRYAAKLTRKHLDFLIKLSQLDQRDMFLDQWSRWPVIWRWAHEDQFSSPEESKIVRMTVEHCADRLRNTRIPFHRTHGDFAPWNVLMGAEGLRVIDWEDSEESGLPLFDAVSFGVQVTVLLKNKRLSLEQLLRRSPSILAIDDELDFLVSSMSLNKVRGFSHDQLQALIALCVVVAARGEYYRDPPGR